MLGRKSTRTSNSLQPWVLILVFNPLGLIFSNYELYFNGLQEIKPFGIRSTLTLKFEMLTPHTNSLNESEAFLSPTCFSCCIVEAWAPAVPCFVALHRTSSSWVLRVCGPCFSRESEILSPPDCQIISTLVASAILSLW